MNEHIRAAWLNGNGVSVVENSDEDRAHAKPLMNGDLLSGEPGGTQLQFTPNGGFLMLLQLQSSITVRALFGFGTCAQLGALGLIKRALKSCAKRRVDWCVTKEKVVPLPETKWSNFRLTTRIANLAPKRKRKIERDVWTRPGSKQALVVEMLSKHQGTTLDALAKETPKSIVFKLGVVRAQSLGTCRLNGPYLNAFHKGVTDVERTS
jgi:hypothetical protein